MIKNLNKILIAFDWFELYGMVINPDQFPVVTINRYNRPDKRDKLKTDSKVIDFFESTTILGF